MTTSHSIEYPSCNGATVTWVTTTPQGAGCPGSSTYRSSLPQTGLFVTQRVLSTGVVFSSGSRPCCTANSAAAARLEAPILA